MKLNVTCWMQWCKTIRHRSSGDVISGLTNHTFQSGNLMEGLGGVWGKGLGLAVANRMVLWYLSNYIVTSAEFGGGGIILRDFSERNVMFCIKDM